MQCVIQWIAPGTTYPTPDTNDAIGYVYQEAYTLSYPHLPWHKSVDVLQSQHYPICAEHAKRLREPGMEKWHFVPLKEE